jgi:hypothetical protein
LILMFRANRQRSRLESTVSAKSFSGKRQGTYFGESADSVGFRLPRAADCMPTSRLEIFETSRANRLDRINGLLAKLWLGSPSCNHSIRAYSLEGRGTRTGSGPAKHCPNKRWLPLDRDQASTLPLRRNAVYAIAGSESALPVRGRHPIPVCGK